MLTSVDCCKFCVNILKYTVDNCKSILCTSVIVMMHMHVYCVAIICYCSASTYSFSVNILSAFDIQLITKTTCYIVILTSAWDPFGV